MGLKFLSNEDIQRIHEMTLELLESIGIWFHDCPEAVELFEKHGCSADGYRVRIPRQVVAESLASIPDRDKLKLCVTILGFGDSLSLKKGDTHIGMIGNPYYIHEHGKGHRNVLESGIPGVQHSSCAVGG